MAEMAFPPQQQEAGYRYLVVQREVMSAGRADTIQGNKREILADTIFDSAEISAYDQAKQRAAEEKDNKKFRIRHMGLLLPKRGKNANC